MGNKIAGLLAFIIVISFSIALAQSQIIVDTQPPVTTIDPDGSGDWVNFDLNYGITCVDEGPNVCARIEFVSVVEGADCTGFAPVENIGGLEPFNYVDMTNCPPGSVCRREICYRGTDTASPPNVEAIKRSDVFQLDMQNPVTVADPNRPVDGKNGWFLTGDPLGVNLIADDFLGSGVDQTKYCQDENNTCNPSTTYTAGMFIAVIGEGPHFLRFASTDVATNQEDVEIFFAGIDSSDPEISIDYVAYESDPVTGNSTDPESGIYKVFYNVSQWFEGTTTPVDGYQNIEADFTGGTGEGNSTVYFDATPEGLPGGRFLMKIWAENMAGRESVVAFTNFTTDMEAPNVSFSVLGSHWNGEFTCTQDNEEDCNNESWWWQGNLSDVTISATDISSFDLYYCVYRLEEAGSCDPLGENGTLCIGGECRFDVEGEGASRVMYHAVDSLDNVNAGTIYTQIDWTEPRANLTAAGTDGFEWYYPTEERWWRPPEEVVEVALIATGNDTAEAGIPYSSEMRRTVIHYIKTGEGKTEYGEKICEPPTFDPKDCWTANTHFTENMEIRYYAEVIDGAGNINRVPDDGYNIVAFHPLANFFTNDLFVVMGTSENLIMSVRNLDDEPIDVVISLLGEQSGGYDYAYAIDVRGFEGEDFESFTISNGGRLIGIDGLVGWGGALVDIEVLSSEPRTIPYMLRMNASSFYSASGEGAMLDDDEMTILTGYPASFPGLELWAIILLVGLAGLVYSRISFV